MCLFNHFCTEAEKQKILTIMGIYIDLKKDMSFYFSIYAKLQKMM